MYDGHRLRVKKRFASEGFSSFQDYEVLELLLFYAIPQGDVKPLAKKLLAHFHTLRAVFDADIESLKKVSGIGEHTATLITMVPRLSQFYVSLASRDKKTISSTAEAGRYVCDMIGANAVEVFSVICLDSKRRVLAFKNIETGTVTQANVHPRKVVEFAIRHNAAAVILAHNHPSGTMQASENDRMITRQLCDLFEGLGIHVIDHIIAAGPTRFLSMSDNGIMPN